MGKKNMKIISSLLLFNKKNKETWQWPSCKHPKTLSFRAENDTMFKTVNSVFFDAIAAEAEVVLTTPDSCFTNSSESASISTDSEEFLNNECSSSLESVVRGARSERLFFEPGSTTCSSILEVQGSGRKECVPAASGDDGVGDGGGDGGLPYKESVAMALESEDPYGDFKKSMEEMVESHGLKDWEHLEELLGWYLRINAKNNHEFIVQAFVDLLIRISGGDRSGGGGNASCSDQSTASFTSAPSTFSSPVSSPLSQVCSDKEIIEEENMVTS